MVNHKKKRKAVFDEEAAKKAKPFFDRLRSAPGAAAGPPPAPAADAGTPALVAAAGPPPAQTAAAGPPPAQAAVAGPPAPGAAPTTAAPPAAPALAGAGLSSARALVVAGAPAPVSAAGPQPAPAAVAGAPVPVSAAGPPPAPAAVAGAPAPVSAAGPPPAPAAVAGPAAPGAAPTTTAPSAAPGLVAAGPSAAPALAGAGPSSVPGSTSGTPPSSTGHSARRGQADRFPSIPAFVSVSTILSQDEAYFAAGNRKRTDCLQPVTDRDDYHLAQAFGWLERLRAYALTPGADPARDAAMVEVAVKVRERVRRIQPPRDAAPSWPWSADDDEQEVVGTTRLVAVSHAIVNTAVTVCNYAGIPPGWDAPHGPAAAAAVLAALSDAATHAVSVKNARVAFVEAKVQHPDDPFWVGKSYIFTLGTAGAMALSILGRPRSTPQLERDVVRLGLISQQVMDKYGATAGATFNKVLTERAASGPPGHPDVRKLDTGEMEKLECNKQLAWWAPGRWARSDLAPPDLGAADRPSNKSFTTPYTDIVKAVLKRKADIKEGKVKDDRIGAFYPYSAIHEFLRRLPNSGWQTLQDKKKINDRICNAIAEHLKEVRAKNAAKGPSERPDLPLVVRETDVTDKLRRAYFVLVEDLPDSYTAALHRIATVPPTKKADTKDLFMDVVDALRALKDAGGKGPFFENTAIHDFLKNLCDRGWGELDDKKKMNKRISNVIADHVKKIRAENAKKKPGEVLARPLVVRETDVTGKGASSRIGLAEDCPHGVDAHILHILKR